MLNFDTKNAMSRVKNAYGKVKNLKKTMLERLFQKISKLRLKTIL